ncbi:DUF4132 domain-containing protein [Nocardia sp. CA-135398]|uniref:DUF4132 domain-containing protein n=1 Tax=Nocardia sp. CA-135398 TaxID=3239977 RepID=UPI003D99A90B
MGGGPGQQLRTGTGNPLEVAASDPRDLGDWVLEALAQADPALAEPILRAECTWLLWSVNGLMAVTAAHGAAAHDLVTGAIAADPRELAAAIAPFESPTVAAFVVDRLGLRTEQGHTAAVRDAAHTRVADVAGELGLSEDQLADRMVPDLGLRPDGTALLDFGPRQFVLGFDEQLRPTVTGTEGTRYKALPKAGVRDDDALVAAAIATYRSLRKSVEKFAADQIRRLERAMVTERRFTLDELRTQFIAHPVRINVTRRLIWATYRDDQVLDSFRITEDNTFADADTTALDIAENAVIGIAHPLHLGTELTAVWAEVLADYELRQPFPQLEREVYQPHPELLASSSALIPANTTVPLGRIHGLTNRGWNPPERGDGGRIGNPA